MDEEELDKLLYLINKYRDKISIKVGHYIPGNINDGVMGHRSQYSDYEDIEEIRKDENGNVEIEICIID